jgi:hypothetical protein
MSKHERVWIEAYEAQCMCVRCLDPFSETNTCDVCGARECVACMPQPACRRCRAECCDRCRTRMFDFACGMCGAKCCTRCLARRSKGGLVCVACALVAKLSIQLRSLALPPQQQQLHLPTQ